jgi:hypothetical protein
MDSFTYFSAIKSLKVVYKLKFLLSEVGNLDQCKIKGICSYAASGLVKTRKLSYNLACCFT